MSDIASWSIFLLGAVVTPLIFRGFMSPEYAGKKAYVFLSGMLFVFIGFVASFSVFRGEASIAMIAFGSLFILPYVVMVIERQPPEKKAGANAGKKKFYGVFARHRRLGMFFLLLFLGMTAEYTMLFFVLPPGTFETAFQHQVLYSAGSQASSGLYGILLYDAGLIAACFGLSVLFGAGAVFLLNYNASMASVFIGIPLRGLLWGMAFPPHPSPALYLVCGILTTAGLLVASVGGSMLAKKHSGRTEWRDSVIFLAVSLVIIFFSSVLEAASGGL